MTNFHTGSQRYLHVVQSRQSRPVEVCVLPQQLYRLPTSFCSQYLMGIYLVTFTCHNKQRCSRTICSVAHLATDDHDLEHMQDMYFIIKWMQDAPTSFHLKRKQLVYAN